MRNLLIIRHAKSSWDNPDLMDSERPLNNRGIKDSSIMRQVLKEKNIKIDKIYSSDAIRAKQTISIIAPELNYKEDDIEFISELYHASRKELIEFIRKIDDKFLTVAIVGHNPGLTDLTHFFIEDFDHELPTCAMLFLELNISSWRNIESNCGRLIFFEYPKKYKI